MALEPWAKSEAQALMAPLGDRWQHVQAVADEARRIGLDLADEDRDVLVAAAYLHDIGYAPSLNRLGFHPVDGAWFLRQHGHERLARLVAHHSGARFGAEERGLLDELAAFPVEDGPVLDALTFADMTTGPAGEAVTLEERVGEILDAGRVAVRRPRILVDYQVLVSEPKAAKGRRSLALDPVTVAALRAHRARQGEERLAVGSRYQDSELVFTRPDGTAVHPERFSDWFRQHVQAAGLPRIRLHDVPQLRDGDAGRWRPGQGGQRAAGARQHRHHHGHLQPCPARPGRAGRRPGRPPHPGRRRPASKDAS
jgi:hypothetical protein